MNISTRDVLTPANAFTLFGLALVAHGSIQLHAPIGVIEIILGRLLDVLDGPLARATHSSPFGATIDAVSDKLAIACILVASWHYGTSPLVFILYVLFQNLANALISITAHAHGRRLQASREGKRTMFLQSTALAAYAIASLSLEDRQPFIGILATVFALASVYFGIRATTGYFLAATGQPTHK